MKKWYTRIVLVGLIMVQYTHSADKPPINVHFHNKLDSAIIIPIAHQGTHLSIGSGACADLSLSGDLEEFSFYYHNPEQNGEKVVQVDIEGIRANVSQGMCQLSLVPDKDFGSIIECNGTPLYGTRPAAVKLLSRSKSDEILRCIEEASVPDA